MKKIIFILTIGMLSYGISMAQGVAMVNPNALAIDTATQAAAEGPVAKVIGSKKTISIVLPVTKISGTIAGSVSWQGSNDGVKYYTISTTALTDATNVYGYKEIDKGFLYYKVLITQTGTSSLSYSAIYYTTTLQ